MIKKQVRGMALAAVDDEHLPLVISTFRGNIELELAQWHHSVTSVILRHRYCSGQPVLYITDASGMHVPSAVVRRFWAEIMKENQDMMNQLLGNWVVMASPLMRGALTAIEWFTPLERRIQYTGTIHEAIDQANECLAKAGHAPVVVDGRAYCVP